MPISFQQLITVPTVEEIESVMLGVLDQVGFRTTSWQDGSAPKHIVRSFSEVTVDLWYTVAQLARGAFLSFAIDEWLTVKAEDDFAIVRDAATKTAGTAVLLDEGGAPYTVTVGQFRISDASGTKIYVATTGGTLGVGDTLAITVEAEQAGADYNVANDSLTVMVDSVAGVSVSNPDNGTGTWITSPGQDEQSDDSLRSECRAKWSTLAMGVAESAYEAWVKAAVPTITQVKVYADNPLGPGSVRVLLANASGGATAAEVQAADDFVRPRKAIGTSTLALEAATNAVVEITGTIYVAAAFLAQAQAQHLTDLATLQRETGIAGEIPLSVVYETLMAPNGVTKVTLTVPTGDTQLGTEETAVFDVDLTYVSL